MKFLLGASLYLVFVNGVFVSSNDANNALAMVNQARQAKGVQPLLWDASLVTYAQYWADEMASGRRPFEHAQGANRPSQGENLYEQSAGQCDAAYDNPLQTGMHAWLSQEHLYTGQPIMTGHEPWLHWAQCVWSATTNIGCARAYAISEPYKFFDVCRFTPEGNIVGQKPF
ncbi:hypothetical protein C2857_004327 [Epichloe festucae Fl1]|uniref:SCP domain-containing protein n=1 Tax=Epichloe festucae (strain Fl1) TaxID=877507 RepID=A0A7S9PVH3_EPIFF|nr:hypothetical protein C2857_004327 [Epichloe festucae Fl1]